MFTNTFIFIGCDGEINSLKEFIKHASVLHTRRNKLVHEGIWLLIVKGHKVIYEGKTELGVPIQHCIFLINILLIKHVNNNHRQPIKNL